MDWILLLITCLGAAIALYSWRWSVQVAQANLKGITGRSAEQGSGRYKMLSVNRWGGVAFGAFVFLGGLVGLLGGH